MANSWGYPVVQTDRAGLWFVDGYANITDGSGAANLGQIPSGVVQSVVRNSTGNYSIILKAAWYKLAGATVTTVLPAGSSPTCLVAQVQKFTVGSSAVAPISSGGVGQSVTFQIYNPSTLAAAELPLGSGFMFLLELQSSSA